MQLCKPWLNSLCVVSTVRCGELRSIIYLFLPFGPFQLNKEFQAEEAPTVILCISMQWFREWESFVKGKDNGTRTHKHIKTHFLGRECSLCRV